VEVEGQEVKKPPSEDSERQAVAPTLKPPASPAAEQSSDARPSKSLLSATLLVALAIAAVAAGALTAALTLRRFDYKQQVIINDFLVPTDSASSDSKSGASGDFGKEVADIFASDLNDIIQQGSVFGKSYGEKRRISQPFTDIPKIPVSKSYGIEIQGISIDQLLKAWNTLRYDQQLVSGDIIPAATSHGRYVLQISLRSDRAAQHWTSRPFLASHKELFAAMQATAEDFVTNTNPEIAGRYFLATKQYSRAIQVFTYWLKLEPARPEPNLYLAKTLIFDEEYERAQVFADRALNSISLIARKNHQQMQTESELAKATALWGARDDKDAEQLFVNHLSKQPYALNNLGVLYLETGRYADAERVLQQALKLEPGDFGAAMVLGQAYSADHHDAEAAAAFKSALQIKPTSSEAADSYLAALHAAKRDQEASQFCHAWVGTTMGAEALVTDETADLYVLCAQAEKEMKQVKMPALALYYVEALARPVGEGSQAALSSAMVDKMPEVLCRGNNDGDLLGGANQSGEQTARLAAATHTLTGILRNRASADPRAAGLIKNCESSTDYLVQSLLNLIRANASGGQRCTLAEEAVQIAVSPRLKEVAVSFRKEVCAAPN
jgi:tetratricopeptide (TPR) repeat protein